MGGYVATNLVEHVHGIGNIDGMSQSRQDRPEIRMDLNMPGTRELRCPSSQACRPFGQSRRTSPDRSIALKLAAISGLDMKRDRQPRALRSWVPANQSSSRAAFSSRPSPSILIGRADRTPSLQFRHDADNSPGGPSRLHQQYFSASAAIHGISVPRETAAATAAFVHKQCSVP